MVYLFFASRFRHAASSTSKHVFRYFSRVFSSKWCFSSSAYSFISRQHSHALTHLCLFGGVLGWETDMKVTNVPLGAARGVSACVDRGTLSVEVAVKEVSVLLAELVL
jgi:hypothetical protein